MKLSASPKLKGHLSLFISHFSLLTSHFSSRSGFTLIELLVVIAVLAILALSVLAAINPAAKINSAKDVNQKSNMAQIVNALQAYTTTSAGNAYPPLATGLGTIVPGELKSLPNQQTGATACPVSPNGTTPGTTYCYVINGSGAIAVWGSLFSTGLAAYCWDSTNGAYKIENTGWTLPLASGTAVCP